MTTPTAIVIVGGGYAGIFAAQRLAHLTRRASPPVAITLISAAPTFVERIRLHQYASGQTEKPTAISDLLCGTGVSFREAKVKAIDPAAHTLQLSDGAALGYDRLILALGSQTDRHGIPGAADHAVTLDSPLMWADDLRQTTQGGGHIVVLGGGATGIEAAAEIAETYPSARVHLITRERFGSDFHANGERYLRRTLTALGVTLHESSAVSRVEAGRVVLADGRALAFDLCINAAGFVAPPLARHAGLTVNGRGQALIDGLLRSISHPDITVIGDAAAFAPTVGVSTRMGCVTAMPMGYHAASVIAESLAGRTPEPFNFGYMARCLSLGRRRGLVQSVDVDDQPQARVITGRFGALVKELICRYTVWSLHIERRVTGLYPVPKGRRAGQPHPPAPSSWGEGEMPTHRIKPLS